jgi:putative restriction endonuclease
MTATVLSRYQERLTRLVVNRRDGQFSPHKVCMLLAVLDLAMGGGLASNRIVYGPALLERYRRMFAAVARPGDHANPYFPFFHLKGRLQDRSASFWHLQAMPGRESIVEAMSTVRSDSDILKNIAWAWLDTDLFALVQDTEAAAQLSDTLTKHWFERGMAELRRVAGRCHEVSRYERSLREGSVVEVGESGPPAYVRDGAFRRVVIESYDYRCAATGLRVLLDGGEAMVEAAHIHPHAVSGDDDPSNGLALTPDMHWAMDRNLIAPGPDLRWHVSQVLDDRIPDFARLVALEGRDLFLPVNRSFVPRADVLEWRLDRLRQLDWRPAAFP